MYDGLFLFCYCNPVLLKVLTATLTLLLLNAFSNLVLFVYTVPLYVTDVNLLQLSNALSPILVTLSGIVIEVKL